MKSEAEITQIAAKIKLVIFDVDGVLTDGGIYFSDNGEESKRFSSLDGQGIKMLQNYGIKVAIITARETKSVAHRMKNLGIKHFYQNQTDKLNKLQELCQKLAITPAETAYMGDDLPDLPAMQTVGLSAAPTNAHDLIKQAADLITKKSGGFGAARELCDLILKAQASK